MKEDDGARHPGAMGHEDRPSSGSDDPVVTLLPAGNAIGGVGVALRRIGVRDELGGGHRDQRDEQDQQYSHAGQELERRPDEGPWLWAIW